MAAFAKHWSLNGAFYKNISPSMAAFRKQSSVISTFYKIMLAFTKQHFRNGSLFWWWRHPKEAFSALLAICAGNSPVTGDFPAQRPATWSFDVSFDLRLNKRSSKQSWGWWFETRAHCDVTAMFYKIRHDAPLPTLLCDGRCFFCRD